ncbi:MAG: R3H domain-containing nucleic acid-binding protein [Candidatus Berkelbacteria bacterium]
MSTKEIEEIVKLFFKSFDSEAVIDVVEKDEDNRKNWWIKVSSPNSGHLIGKMGETLEAIQYIIRLMVSEKSGEFIPVTVDVDEYKEKKETELIELAKAMAENVKNSGYGQEMRPMSAYARRIVHMTLKDFPGIKSDSIGEGELRRVKIEPLG